jgi:putative tryptophan/tyrosine transport system substrate-binding protein
MRRRKFIILTGSAVAAWPFIGRAQQAMPVVGFLNGESPDRYARFAAAFRHGLGESGYIEGQNVKIEYRWAEGHYDRLPALVTELIEQKAAVIAACGGDSSTFAARAATTTIPIVFLLGSDPTKYGVVASYNRPGGNLTGVTLMLNDFMPKRLELLLEFLPQAKLVSFMTNPNSPASVTQGDELREAAITKGLQLAVVAKAGSEAEITEAYANFSQQNVDAVILDADSFYQNKREQIVALAARYRLPTMYFSREFIALGGLMSYGTSIPDIYRQLGIYIGRILKGAKPADLPVLRPTKFELAVNLKTAKALGLTVPPTVLARADEVIE